MTITPLTQALDLAIHAVEKRSTVPILSNIRITQDMGTRLIEATDLDTVLRVEMDCKGAAFKTTASAHKVRDIVNVLGGEPELAASATDDRLYVGGVYILPGLPASEWPEMADKETVATITLDRATLLSDLRDVSPAISTEETRYYLNGIFVHVHKPAIENSALWRLRFAATDGHRLHYIERELPAGGADIPDTIIPRAAVNLLVMALEQNPTGGPVEVSVSPERIAFKFDRTSITSRTIDGTFPDYRRVIPESAPDNPVLKSSGAILVQASELRKRVDEARALASEAYRLVTLNLVAMKVEASCSENGKYAGDFPAKRIGTPPPKIGFNGRNLSAALSPYGSAPLRLDLTDKAGPMLITSPDHPLACVVMPMRVD